MTEEEPQILRLDDPDNGNSIHLGHSAAEGKAHQSPQASMQTAGPDTPPPPPPPKTPGAESIARPPAAPPAADG